MITRIDLLLAKFFRVWTKYESGKEKPYQILRASDVFIV